MTSQISPEENLYRIRFNELERIIWDIANRINFYPPHLEIMTSIDHVPSTNGHWVFLPYLFLLRTADIPERFRVMGFDDPRLYDEVFLNEFASWSRKYLGLGNRSLTESDKYTLRLFLNFIRDPKLSELAKFFVLTHEIAHKYLNHHKRNQSTGFTGKNTVLRNLFAKTPKAITKSRGRESAADFVAANILPESIPGGIYLFEKMCEHGKKERAHSLEGRISFSPKGNNRLFFFTHPAEDERMQYLRELHLRKGFQSQNI